MRNNHAIPTNERLDHSNELASDMDKIHKRLTVSSANLKTKAEQNENDIWSRKGTTYTRTTMLHRPVRARKFGKIMTSHLRFDLDRIEDLCLRQHKLAHAFSVHTLPL
jgi:hypothetical protein